MPAESPIEVFVGIGDKLDRFRTPFSPKTAFPGRGWVVEDIGHVLLDGSETDITWRLIRSGTERAISYHWMKQDRGLFEESVRSFLALDRSPFARVLPVMVMRISTEIEELTPEEISRAHDRLAEMQALVETAIEVMQDRLRASETAETARLPNLPLWESFFPIAAAPDVDNINKNSYLECFRAVA